jgi:hypothetical protein
MSDLDIQQTHLKVSLLNRSSHLAAALGVVIAMNLPHFVVLLKSDLDVQETGHRVC